MVATDAYPHEKVKTELAEPGIVELVRTAADSKRSRRLFQRTLRLECRVSAYFHSAFPGVIYGHGFDHNLMH
jgi:hypothetical protein